MAEWTQCPSCLLKHVARPDGLCPRCRHPLVAPGWGNVGASTPLAPPGPVAPSEAVAPPPSSPASEAAPPPVPTAYPTSAYPGSPPAPPAGMAAAPYAFTVGRYLSSVFTTWGKAAGFIVPVALLTYAPVAVAMYRTFSGLGALEGRSNPFDPAFLLAFAGVFVFLMVLTPVLHVAIARAAVRRLQGEPTGFGDMLAVALRFYFPTFGLLFLVGLAILGTACTVVVPWMLLTAWAAALPAMFTERLGPVEALRRSWALTRGLRWQVFAGLLVVVLVTYAVSCLVGGLMGGVAGAVLAGAGAGDPSGAMGTMAGVQAVNMLLQGLYYSLHITATAVAYHQLRLAAEGPPTQSLAQVFA